LHYDHHLRNVYELDESSKELRKRRTNGGLSEFSPQWIGAKQVEVVFANQDRVANSTAQVRLEPRGGDLHY
jgi:hypothetical protein